VKQTVDRKTAELRKIEAHSKTEAEILAQKLQEHTQKAAKLERELELLRTKSMQQPSKPQQIPQQLHPVTNQPFQNSSLLSSQIPKNNQQTTLPREVSAREISSGIHTLATTTMIVVVDTNVFMQTENLSSLWLIDHIVGMNLFIIIIIIIILLLFLSIIYLLFLLQ